MTLNSRNPAFIQLDYHSPYAPHKQQLCLKDWFPVSSGHPMGTCTAHDNTSVDLADMINNLVDVMAPFALSDTSWDLATVYTQAAATGPAFPQASMALTQVGSSPGAAPRKATEVTFVMRTASFGIVKMVLLDVPVNTNFDPVLNGDFSATDLAFLDEFEAPQNAWVGMDNSKPQTGIKKTFNLNQKLRKEYRMV